MSETKPPISSTTQNSESQHGLTQGTMRTVMDAIDRKTEELGKAPLFEFLANKELTPEQRLSFAPHVAHFVMSFADLYSLVLSEDRPGDKYQELVNAHAREDENHWRWYLQDLGKLGVDGPMAFSDALKLVWGEDTVKMRLLSYKICQLGYEADSLTKLVLVEVIESAGKVTVGPVSEVGAEFGARTKQTLVYLGPHHSDTESDHTLEDEETHQMVEGIEISPEECTRLLKVVDETFACFRGFIDEMYIAAKRESSQLQAQSA